MGVVQYQGVDVFKRKGVLGAAGTGWARFHIVEFAISESAADEAEADNVVGGRVHVNDHGREEEEVSDSVILVVGTAWFGVVALRLEERCPEGWDV